MHQPPAFQKQLEDYVLYLERLTVRSIRLIEKLVSSDIRLIGPGYDVRGLDAVEAQFAELFENAQRHHIQITDSSWGRDGYTAYLRWTRINQTKRNGPEHRTDGISEIIFGPDGMVVQHRDYWADGVLKSRRFPFLP